MREIIKTEKEANVVEIKDFIFDNSKIYICRDIDGEFYKLCEYTEFLNNTKVNPDQYNFVWLDGYAVWADDWKDQNDLFEIILDEGEGSIYEFDSFDDFINFYKEER